MKFIKIFILIFISIIGGIGLTFLFASTIGFSSNFFWTGMYHLEQTGFPFLWRTECPKEVPFSVPTGCMDGLNITAFSLNILIFFLILFIFINLMVYIFKNIKR